MLLTMDSVTHLPEQVRDRAVLASQMMRGTRAAVAFSGGVDSSVLLGLAVAQLGPQNVVPVLGVSASLAADERAAAHRVADFIGVKILEISTFEGARPAYVANGPDRCFHCKDELFTRINDDVVQRLGVTSVAYGENADDALRPDRPGSRAAVKHRVLRPLAEAGLTKEDVRTIARAWDLPCADKPAAPCLASRVPHHSPVTPAKLAQVEQAERVLRDLGFIDGRVRHHDEVARIELLPVDLARLGDETLREQLLTGIRAAGFRFVAVDLAGIQSGAFTLPLVAVNGDR